METEFNYDLIQDDYVPNMQQDDDRIYEAKTCIQALNRMEKRILLTYVELQTYAAAAKEFHVSPPTFRKYLQGILEKVRNCAECAQEEEIHKEEEYDTDVNKSIVD